MGPWGVLLVVYVLGGLTFLPLLVGCLLLYAYLTLPVVGRAALSSSRHDVLAGVEVEGERPSSESPREIGKGQSPEADVAAGYFAVCREYVPGGVNGKPPERTTPAGTVVAPESPSVYQSMYRSIFDRSRNPSMDSGKGGRRARNVFYVVLRSVDGPELSFVKTGAEILTDTAT